jgi:hypothetical protein
MSGRWKIRESDICGCGLPFDRTRNPRNYNIPCRCYICSKCVKQQIKYCGLCDSHVQKVLILLKIELRKIFIGTNSRNMQTRLPRNLDIQRGLRVPQRRREERSSYAAKRLEYDCISSLIRTVRLQLSARYRNLCRESIY